jgi:DNA-binding NarL/FixJ family response regulator
VVHGLCQFLARHYRVVGVAYSGEELLQLLPHVEADVLLLDLSLPGRSGLDLLPCICAMRPEMRVLVVTMHVDRVLADAALAAGAMGFIPKDSAPEELRTAIASVLAGHRYVSPGVPRHTHRAALEAVHSGLANITPRQQEILLQIAQGKHSAQIAEQLGVTESTIVFHRNRLRKALGLDSEWALNRFAILVQLAHEEACAESDGSSKPRRLTRAVQPRERKAAPHRASRAAPPSSQRKDRKR